jgi:outer membrane protein
LTRQLIFSKTLLIIFMMVWSVSVYAFNTKIGIVNTDKILRESAPAVIAQLKIEKEFFPRDEQIKKMAARAKELQTQLEKESATLSEGGRRDMERTLASLSREFQRAKRQLREDLSVRQNEEFGIILEYTNEVIKNIAETEEYDLILQLQDSVYRSERIDITEQVLNALENRVGNSTQP